MLQTFVINHPHCSATKIAGAENTICFLFSSALDETLVLNYFSSLHSTQSPHLVWVFLLFPAKIVLKSACFYLKLLEKIWFGGWAVTEANVT